MVNIKEINQKVILLKPAQELYLGAATYIPDEAANL